MGLISKHQEVALLKLHFLDGERCTDKIVRVLEHYSLSEIVSFNPGDFISANRIYPSS
jgi:hypothetical protein